MRELKEVLYSEIEDFREMGHQFVNGELSVMKFKHAFRWFWCLCSS